MKLRLQADEVPIILAADHEIVGVAHDEHITVRRFPPLRNPGVQHIMQIDIGQQWTDAASLRSAFRYGVEDSFFHHSRFQPAADQDDHSPVSNPVVQKAGHPLVVEVVEEPLQIGVQQPVDPLGVRRHQHRVGGLQRTSIGSKPVAETLEVAFIDAFQHQRRGPLDDLVFQRGNSDRALTAIAFGNVDATHRGRPVTVASQTSGEIRQPDLQVCRIVVPGLLVDPRGGVPVERVERRAQHLGRVDVMKQGGQSAHLGPRCRLPYPVQ